MPVLLLKKTRRKSVLENKEINKEEIEQVVIGSEKQEKSVKKESTEDAIIKFLIKDIGYGSF
jgi:hypothetical protein